MIVLLPHCAFLSETSRMISIYRSLRDAGADVRMATHGGPHARQLDASGIAYDRLDPVMSDVRCREFLLQIPGITDHSGSCFTDEELRTYSAAEAGYFREVRARAVVTGFTLTALLSSRLAGIPLITEHAGSFVPPIYERGLLPAPSRAPFPLGWLLPGRIQRWLANNGPPRVGSFCAGFNRVAAELGVEPVPSLGALLLGDLTLVTDVPEVTGVSREELEAWTPRLPAAYRRDPVLRYVGPLYAELDVPVPDEVDRFLAAPGPVVYVAITSSGADLVRGVVAAVRAAGVRVLVAGTVHDFSDLAGPELCVAGVLPSHRIFPRVALGVVAGGQGSVQTAMASGVPIVGVPLQPEQDWNVVAVERLGAAIRVPAHHAAGPVMTTAVRRLLDDGGARAAARRIQAIYTGWDGPKQSAEHILGWLDTRAHGRRRVNAPPSESRPSP